MKNSIKILTLILFVFGIIVFTAPAYAYVGVKGYYRSNGTYVQPYVRSNPNALKYDNYSYRGGSLYNNSYYSSSQNYSSGQYQPSYLTDSNYYTGKSLYQNKSYGSSLYPSYGSSYSSSFYGNSFRGY